MILFIQSYGAPQVMGNDIEMYRAICKYFRSRIKTISVYSEKLRNISAKEVAKQAYDVVKTSKHGDVLFSWGGDSAIYCWCVSKILFKPRMILGQNLIVNPEMFATRIKQRIRGWLYGRALRSGNFYMTVNSEPLRAFYAKTFRCAEDRFYVVNDAMVLHEEDVKGMDSRKREQPYVFCGGKEQRDVNCFLRIVARLPNVQFKAVFLKSMLPADMPELKNLQLFNNTSKDDFFDIMCNATICCIPLKAQSPCGLTVMQKAVLMGQPIVSTDTPSMRTIIPDDNYGYLLPRGDDGAMAAKIELLLADSALRDKLQMKAKDNMRNFQPEVVAKQLCYAMDDVAGKVGH